MSTNAIQTVASGESAFALESATLLLADAGFETGMCRFLPSGVAEWVVHVRAHDLPALGALLVSAGLQLTRGGQVIFATLCQYALHSRRLPRDIAVARLPLTIEVHAASPASLFDDSTLQLPLPA